VDARDLRWEIVAQPARKDGAPVGAVRDVALVAQHIRHERVHRMGHGAWPDQCGRLAGETRVGQGDHHHVAVLGELLRHVEVLQVAARPAVHQHDGQPARTLLVVMHVVQVDTTHVGEVLRLLVQALQLGRGVEIVQPVIDQRTQARLVRAHLPGIALRQVGPLEVFEALGNALQPGLRHRDLESFWLRHGFPLFNARKQSIVDMTTQQRKSVEILLT
jgi:hypothetical protein